MAIRYKIDILAELKKRGYTSTKIREEKLIGNPIYSNYGTENLFLGKLLIQSAPSWTANLPI